MSLQPVILSGGSGTRLWPLSREAYPKQFLPLTSEYTLFQETLRRLDGLEAEHPHLGIGVLDPLIVCNEVHRFLVAEQLRLLERAGAAILLEPVGRNTAPALTLAALAAMRGDHDPILLVMPADHSIANEPAFRGALADAYQLAAAGQVVTFGIVPTKPETGYGYLRLGERCTDAGLAGAAHRLAQFVEKPDATTAEGYFRSGDYLWNSGLFMLRASLWLELIERFRPDIAEAAAATFASLREDGDFVRIDSQRFAACPADSIDYAVMERLTGTNDSLPASVVVALDVGWSDVGAWSALWENRERDESGNVMQGDTFAHDVSNSLLMAQHRMVAAVGVDDLIVIETADAVLVANKARAQDVKRVTQFLQRQQRQEYVQHQRVHRPWGSYECIDIGQRYQVKRLTVKPQHALSLQMHHHRAEHWVVVSGTARVTTNETSCLLTENQSTYIPIGTTHRLENPGRIPLELIEVQSGSYLGEDDIVRFEDRYNRCEEG